MITSIRGKVTCQTQHALILAVGNVSYEIYASLSVLQRITENQDSDGEIVLFTYHYYQMTPSSATPVLVGFLNVLERDFFMEFIKVSGIGPRAAVRALNKSIGEIAQAIDRGDLKFLTTLPGIGAQRAKEIIAKLQDKMGRFTLMRDKVSAASVASAGTDIQIEAMTILSQLQYKKSEAEEMIASALRRNKEIATSEELLNEIYKQRVRL